MIRGNVYSINHQYFVPIEIYFRYGLSGKGKRMTKCYIVKRNKFSLRMQIGIAICSKQDQFVKAIGRALALSRAIEDLPEFIQVQILELYRWR